MLTTAGATCFTTGAKVRLICWVEAGTVSCASAGKGISAATIRPIRAIQNRIGSLQYHTPSSNMAGQSHMTKHAAFLPPPSWGRVGVGVVLSAAQWRQAEPPRPPPNPPPPPGGGPPRGLRAPYGIALPNMGGGEGTAPT